MTREEAQQAIEEAYAEYDAIRKPAEEQYWKDIEGTVSHWPMGAPAPMGRVMENQRIRDAAQRRKEAITVPAFNAYITKVNRIKQEAGITDF